MIQANELRLGNIVDNTYNNELVICEEILNNSVNYMDEYSVMHNFPVEELIGIPLTPEILEKCGLKQDMESARFNYTDYESKDLFVRLDDKNYKKGSVFIRVGDLIGLRFDSPYHLHQLQNLYFALTGKELPITL